MRQSVFDNTYQCIVVGRQRQAPRLCVRQFNKTCAPAEPPARTGDIPNNTNPPRHSRGRTDDQLPLYVPYMTQKIVQVRPSTIHELQIAILSFALESLSDIYTIPCDNLRPSLQSVAQINPSSSKHVRRSACRVF